MRNGAAADSDRQQAPGQIAVPATPTSRASHRGTGQQPATDRRPRWSSAHRHRQAERAASAPGILGRGAERARSPRAAFMSCTAAAAAEAFRRPRAEKSTRRWSRRWIEISRRPRNPRASDRRHHRRSSTASAFQHQQELLAARTRPWKRHVQGRRAAPGRGFARHVASGSAQPGAALTAEAAKEIKSRLIGASSVEKVRANSAFSSSSTRPASRWPRWCSSSTWASSRA